ncbi:nitroreductase family deazaflavin-dependent oxidoreductase [Mycobacterium talmoniae]|uniref:Deazaflavin-dependent nitroreductase n=1 Tax=Mycobacterium talmoniae TaxID=1858794 RepID=A0A2S8BN50_9MYCO|nr:nitroreductase family deazaflavin-dependent oxidoreductase [Mycobacterium talmoniae]PQM48039.1 Deazaflavin-dependent nitroreductase [Mycobacterium talmoniae]
MKHYKGVWGWITATFPPAKPGGRGWRLEQAVTRTHVRVFQRTRGRLLGSFDGAPLLILNHTGAKTGQRRKSPMIYLPNGEDLVVVASIGGNPKNPAWYHNLLAHPNDVEVDVRGGRRRVHARQATDQEAEQLWPRLIEMWPAWQTYMTRTDRRFPVMILEPR